MVCHKYVSLLASCHVHFHMANNKMSLVSWWPISVFKRWKGEEKAGLGPFSFQSSNAKNCGFILKSTSGSWPPWQPGILTALSLPRSLFLEAALGPLGALLRSTWWALIRQHWRSVITPGPDVTPVTWSYFRKSLLFWGELWVGVDGWVGAGGRSAVAALWLCDAVRHFEDQ